MSTISGIIGFAIFKLPCRYLRTSPLSPAENVLVISTATATGAMPVTAGFVGVIPALEFLVGPAENGPLALPILDLILWTMGLCLFGLVLAAWLRPYFVERQDLPWPGAKVTAQLVKTLHHLPSHATGSASPTMPSSDDPVRSLLPDVPSSQQPLLPRPSQDASDMAVKTLFTGSLASGLLVSINPPTSGSQCYSK